MPLLLQIADVQFHVARADQIERVGFSGFTRCREILEILHFCACI